MLRKVRKKLLSPVLEQLALLNTRIDDLIAKTDETKTIMLDLHTKADNLHTKADENNTKIDDTRASIDNFNAKANEVNASIDVLNSLMSIYIINSSQYESMINKPDKYNEKINPAVILHKIKYGICDNDSNQQGMSASSLAKKQDLVIYKKRVHELGSRYNLMHRKTWEYVFISQVLFQQGMLEPGKHGLGFAVGSEPLPALFAKYGVKVIASDLEESNTVADQWKKYDAHATALTQLEHPEVCDKETFYKNVSFLPIDMNNIPGDLGDYDFCWSSCAFEHLGSIQKGKEFIYNTLKLLKPGGVSVHTTEYNISSEKSSDIPYFAVFGKEFFDELHDEIVSQGHFFAPLDYRLGNHPDDDYISVLERGDDHFKLLNFKTISTSIGITIIKGRSN